MKQYIFDQFVKNILQHTGLTKEQLFENSRNREYSNARRVLYKLCKDRGFPTKTLESYMEYNGFKCHPNTIPQGLRSLNKVIIQDPDYDIILRKLSYVEA
tara:strand:- start:463 stop:762 length:300 start_codon:yes stop_codon:yes gene_type:complete